MVVCSGGPKGRSLVDYDKATGHLPGEAEILFPALREKGGTLLASPVFSSLCVITGKLPVFVSLAVGERVLKCYSGYAPYPNVAETDGITVVLQLEGAFRRMWFVWEALAVCRGPYNLGVVVKGHAVEEYREKAGALEGIVLEDRRLKKNVEGLPMAGRATGVHEGWMLAVNGSG